MAKLTLKAKLDYSNPSLIRYFEIDDRRTIKDLIRVVMILFGIDDPQDACLNLGKGRIPDDALIEHELSPAVYENTEKRYTITCGVNLLYENFHTYEPLKTMAFMDFGLELETSLSEWETEKALDNMNLLKDSDGPKLISWRGPNLIPYGKKLSEINNTMAELVRGDSIYLSGKGRCKLPDFLPNEELIKQELYNQIVLGITRVTLNRNDSYPLKDILSWHTVDSLCNIIFRQNLPLSFNKNKERLVYRIVDCYNNNNFWLRLIKEMSFEEYEILVNFLRDGKRPPDPNVLKTMANYGLIALANKRLVVPLEFLIWLEGYLNSADAIMLTSQKKGDF